MSLQTKAWAARKGRETEYGEDDWLKAFESARQSLKFLALDSQVLERIALASRSPAKFTVMTRLIYRFGKSHPHGSRITDMFLESVNASPFSMADWIDAIDYFHSWLKDHQRKIDFLPMLKYLECCVAAPDAKSGGQPTLHALVQDMLRVHGYLG